MLVEPYSGIRIYRQLRPLEIGRHNAIRYEESCGVCWWRLLLQTNGIGKYRQMGDFSLASIAVLLTKLLL